MLGAIRGFYGSACLVVAGLDFDYPRTVLVCFNISGSLEVPSNADAGHVSSTYCMAG